VSRLPTNQIGEILIVDEFVEILAVFGVMNLLAGACMVLMIDTKIRASRMLLPLTRAIARLAATPLIAGRIIAAAATERVPFLRRRWR
jgi:hypothetical protein